MTKKESASSVLSEYLLLLLIVFFIFLILLIDYLVPLGISIGLLYVFPVFVTLRLNKTEWSKYIVILVLAFVVLGYFISPEGDHNFFSLLNRFFTVLTILFTSFVGVQLVRSREDYEDKTQIAMNAFEASPSGMLMVNSLGKIMIANREVEQLLGYDRNELLGNSIELLVPDSIKRKHPSLREGFMRSPNVRSMGAGRDLYGKKKNGEQVPLEIGLTPVRTPKGTFVVCSLVDITERKTAEREILQKTEQLKRNIERLAMSRSQLKRSNYELNQFAYVASHDLQAPLRHVKMFTETLSEALGSNQSSEVREMIETTIFSTDKMRTLIDDLLSLSRVQNTQQKLDKVDIAKEVKEICEILKHSTPDQSVNIRVGNLPKEAVCNGGQIRQVFQNLIHNGIKFTKKGNAPEVTVEHEEDESCHRFFIKDNGIGIEDAVSSKSI